MFKWLFNKKAQNTAEYAILIAVIIAATIGIQTWVKRGLMGRVRDVVNHVPAAGTVGGATLTFTGEQFEPGYHTITGMATQRTGTEAKGLTAGGTRSRTLTNYGISSRAGTETEEAPK